VLSVLTLCLVVGLVVGALVTWRAGREPAQAPSEPPGIDPTDLADIDVRFGDVDATHIATRDAVLLAHLQPLVTRKVPVRCVEAVPDLRTVRVRFADGTAVVGHGEVAGDAGILASVVRDHAVLPSACSTDAAGTRLVFDWSGGRGHVAMRVAGLDQPD
jgi:hypothetical protein